MCEFNVFVDFGHLDLAVLCRQHEGQSSNAFLRVYLCPLLIPFVLRGVEHDRLSVFGGFPKRFSIDIDDASRNLLHACVLPGSYCFGLPNMFGRDSATRHIVLVCSNGPKFIIQFYIRKRRWIMTKYQNRHHPWFCIACPRANQRQTQVSFESAVNFLPFLFWDEEKA